MRGASGNIICLCCRNVTRKNSGLAASDRTGMAVELCETDVTKFIEHTDDSLRETVEYMDSCKDTMRTGEFNDLQKALGINYAPFGVFWCAALLRWFFQPIACLMYDWMHICLVNGIYNLEVGCLLKAMRPMRYYDVDKFFAQFTWPWHAKSQGKTVFRKRGDDAEGKKKPTPLSCSASEGIGSFMLLLYFLQVNGVSSYCKLAVESYSRLCTVISLLVSINRGFVVGMNDLAVAVVQYLEAHKRSYGNMFWIPKMHYLLHIPFMFLRHCILVSCFTHERKHKEIKRYVQQRLNSSSTFEKNILTDMLHYQMMMLQEPTTYGDCVAKLVKPKRAQRSLQLYVLAAFNLDPSTQVQTSLLARCPRFVCHVRDVVQVRLPTGSAVGRVAFHVELGGVCWSCIQTWVRLPTLHTYSVKGATVLVESRNIENAYIYKIDGDVAIAIPSVARDSDVCT